MIRQEKVLKIFQVFNPEIEKEKLKLKEKEFEKEIKKKTQQLKPRYVFICRFYFSGD